MVWVVAAGLLAGAVFHDQMAVFKPAVSYLFAYMTFTVALSCSWRDFKQALRSPGLMLLMLALLHLFLPLVAVLSSRLFLPGQPLLQAGVILGTATPVGVSSVIWVGLAGGNLALALTTIITDTIISPVVVPLIMFLTVGQTVRFDVPQLMLGLIWMIVLPTLLGIAGHELSKGHAARQWRFVNGPLNKILLALIIATNLAVAWQSLHLLRAALPFVVSAVFLMGCAGYLCGYAAARLAKLQDSLATTLIFTVGMRNITAGLVLAMKYFSELTAIPVVFAILFQQPLAAVSHKLLKKGRKPPT